MQISDGMHIAAVICNHSNPGMGPSRWAPECQHTTLYKPLTTDVLDR